MEKEYRKLLDECLFALNNLPCQRIPDGDGGDTYKLASKIKAEFNAIRVKREAVAWRRTDTEKTIITEDERIAEGWRLDGLSFEPLYSGE